MTNAACQLDDRALFVTLGQRLRELGVLLVGCDREGRLTLGPAAGEDWLSDLICGSPLFRKHLRNMVGEWETHSDPPISAVCDGMWLAPSPLVVRRRRSGYAVAVIVTDAFVASEQLHAMCQASRLDRTLAIRWLRELPPASEQDIPRLAALVRHLQQYHRQLMVEQSATESTSQQLAESYEEINLLYTIIQSMTVVDRPERFVNIACEELLATLPYGWVGAMLSEDHAAFRRLSGRLVVVGDPGQPIGHLQTLVLRLLRDAKPDAPIVLEPGRKPEHAEFAALGNAALVHPMSREGRVIGLLIAGEKQPQGRSGFAGAGGMGNQDTMISSVDMKLLGATASHMGIFFENAALYDDLNTMFIGTLEALTASIDAKDRYTCGHSQRVAQLSAQLASACGIDDATVRRIHIAGLVHDVGKIGVPERVLCKPGRLNDEEFAWIRKHPEIGYRILKDIPQLSDVLPGVLHHHERWDGRGYPHGLEAERIPMFARIIALADSFDAMSSNRTYRAAMSRQDVLDEIKRCAGAQFDPELAATFAQLDFSEFDRLVREHRAAEADPLDDVPRIEEAA